MFLATLDSIYCYFPCCCLCPVHLGCQIHLFICIHLQNTSQIFTCVYHSPHISQGLAGSPQIGSEYPEKTVQADAPEIPVKVIKSPMKGVYELATKDDMHHKLMPKSIWTPIMKK